MLYPATAEKAHITEIFSSLQGEGTHLGERHLFIRFQECHIHCTYCDELDKEGRAMNRAEVLEEVDTLLRQEGVHSFVSFTGGEPLLYTAFMLPLIKELQVRGLKIYLETGGILWKPLQESLRSFDCIAMDMKPSSVTGERNFYKEHETFLRTAIQKEVFIKIVLSKNISIEEFDKLVDIVFRVKKNIPLILQPISTEIEGHNDIALMQLLQTLQQRAAEKLPDVRIIPRFHKILGIR